MKLGNYDHHAPRGKFRVIGVDTFEGPFADHLIADCTTLQSAIQLASAHGAEMNPVYVYDDKGKFLFKDTGPTPNFVFYWRGKHTHRYPNQSGNAAQRRKIRRANWRAYELRAKRNAPRAESITEFLKDPSRHESCKLVDITKEVIEGHRRIIWETDKAPISIVGGVKKTK
jgi:hypothetical protein